MKLNIDFIAAMLLVIAGLNWGLVGFFQYDLVGTLLGSGMMTRVAYGAVGLAALYELVHWFQGRCAAKSG